MFDEVDSNVWPITIKEQERVLAMTEVQHLTMEEVWVTFGNIFGQSDTVVEDT